MATETPPEGNYTVVDNCMVIDDHISGDTLAEVFRFLLTAPGPELFIYLDSDGGCFSSALTLYRAIKHHPLPITVHALDEVHSSAILLYLAGSKRTANPHTNFMIHECMFQMKERLGNASYIRSMLEKIEADTKSYYEIIAAESGLSVAAIRKNVAAAVNGDWLFGAKEAIKYKIAHKIAHPYPNRGAAVSDDVGPIELGSGRFVGGKTAARKE